ncbi:uncharacterized protein [Thunnus thynnus]|uniref:uncharacterized protein isoform X2 n=1 Tax=Thunnus thynnus TaxID=8237 RepID=UPI003528CD3D
MQSDRSKDDPYNFSKGVPGLHKKERPVSPVDSNVSMKSDRSKDDPYNFSKGVPGPPVSQTQVSSASMKTDQSEDDPLNFSKDLEEDAKHKFTADQKKRILEDYKEELSQHDTELYETVKKKERNHKLVQTYNDIFHSKKNKVRTVLMKGEAGVGKTFQTRLFMVDWANGKSNKNIDLIVRLNFSELRDEVQSMEDLLHFLTSIEQPVVYSYDECEIVFVLDGLEECKLPLDFEKNKDLSDMKERASMDVLLTNLIKGNLLPSARLWIISHPSGVDKIPTPYIHKVTECQETLKRRQQLVSNLKKSYQEKTQVKDMNHPDQENIEHIIEEDRRRKVKDEEKTGRTVVKSVTQVNSISEIFKCKNDQKVRTVLTTGDAGIGKSFHAQKFTQEWAKNDKKSSLINRFIKSTMSVFGQAKDDLEVIFPLSFSKLNSIKEKRFSLLGLLNDFFEETKESVISNYEHFKVVFVLDGLDTCELPLDFDNNDILTDIREPASVDVLLTNLIRGNLFPSAQLWITSRPSGAEKVPDEFVDMKTQIREKDAKHKLAAHLKKKILSQYKVEQGQHETDSQLYEMKDKDKEIKYDAIIHLLKKNKERTVLTRGVAGIGKTFQTRLFMVDWANEKSNKNIDLIVPIDFSKLNSKRDEVQSMEDLLHFLTSIKQRVVCSYDKCEIVFVLDGLEECELPLDFDKNEDLSDMKERASMDVLLTNLIKGNLLPSARLWIISQPSGVDKIPMKYIHKVTECQETLKRRQQLVSNLKKSYQENTQVEDIDHPDQKNTEHIIKEDRRRKVNDEEKTGRTVVKSVTRVNSISEIFKRENYQKVRTVLTTGEGGIGKSLHAEKFTQKWAKNDKKSSFFTWLIDSTKRSSGQAKDDLEVIFPLRFSELNSIKEKRVSLLGLLNDFFEETKESVISNYANFKVLFVLDGLDACELPLDFDNNDTLTDIREEASVDVLLTNLIRGELLPSAHLWITSRPSGAEKVPDKLVHRKTQIRVKPNIKSQRELKSQLKERFNLVSEGIDRQKTSALLNEIYTDLYIVEGERGDVNLQHESREVQEAKFKPVTEETLIKCCDIFNPAPGEKKPIRTVLTIGLAGIGKTFASMKYMLDWAEGTANENIYYTFPFPLRELNLRKENEHSLEDLIHQFFPAMETSEIIDYNKYQILIVLDGLDECRLDLDFSKSKDWTDVRKPTSVNVLLTNLIQGNLLPKAQIWITSRPAASNCIPADKVDRVTEVRGFNDEQKEEYFRKRFSDKDLAEKILSHVKKSRSIYIMCHIPVFCWITAKVLEDFVSRNQEEGMPKTLTDMYIHFLLLQCRQANVKYGGDETDSCWNTRNKETVLSLGKLAFEELEKGNLLFTEEHLTECEIDITETAVFSGLFTQIKQEGCGLYQQKLFCFVHLSIQEFLAAFYVFHTFSNTGENLLIKPDQPNQSDLYKTAVDKALDSKNGDWDLFLRFLLGLSLETNQNLLKELQQKTGNNDKTNNEVIKYIKEKIEAVFSDKNLNLFHCLNELNDHSLVEEVKKYLSSETQAFEKFSASQWSALTYVLLTSDENLDVFDLKKYLKSEKVLLGMLPVVKVSKITLLSWCELSEESCKGLSSSVLSSASSNLTKLDLSDNDLLDSGVQLLADGLESVQCKLEILKLVGCQVTEKGCSFLVSALKSNTASHLKHLDLRYNHPGDKGVMILSAIAEDPKMKLKTLRLDHGGERRLKPGLKKYFEALRFDENTASRRLVLSEGNRGVKTKENVKEKVSRPENKDRFKRSQVLCEEGLKGFCYWEVEWRGTVGIAVAYKEVSRTWDSSGGLGCNKKSWSLLCSKTGYKAMHGKVSKCIKERPCQKIAALLDWEGGTLTYYSVTSGKLSVIHTFRAKFTQPLYPGFWFEKGSVTLCEIN